MFIETSLRANYKDKQKTQITTKLNTKQTSMDASFGGKLGRKSCYEQI